MAYDVVAVHPRMARLIGLMVQARYMPRIVDVVSRLAAPHMAHGIQDNFLVGSEAIFVESHDHVVAVGHKYILRLPKSFQTPGLPSLPISYHETTKSLWPLHKNHEHKLGTEL